MVAGLLFLCVKSTSVLISDAAVIFIAICLVWNMKAGLICLCVDTVSALLSDAAVSFIALCLVWNMTFWCLCIVLNSSPFQHISLKQYNMNFTPSVSSIFCKFTKSCSQLVTQTNFPSYAFSIFKKVSNKWNVIVVISFGESVSLSGYLDRKSETCISFPSRNLIIKQYANKFAPNFFNLNVWLVLFWIYDVY